MLIMRNFFSKPLLLVLFIVGMAGSAWGIAAPTDFVATYLPVTKNVMLTWVNPTTANFSSVTIRRRTNRFPDSITDIYFVVDDSTSTYYSDESLLDGRYYYSIFAKDTSGNVSERATVTADVDTVAPSKPTGFTATITANTTIVLTWVNPTTSDFKSVTIRRKMDSYPSSISDGTLVTENVKITSINYASAPDGHYYFSIFARDNAGNFSIPATKDAQVDTTAPSAPTSVNIVAGSTIYVNWTNPSDLDFASITVRRSLTGFPSALTEGLLVVENTKIQSTSETPTRDGVYYYSLFAKDEFGNVSVKATVSANLNIFSPASPTSFNVVVLGNSTRLSWVSPTDFDFDSITICKSVSGFPSSITSSNTVSKNIKGVSYSDSGLSDGTYYYSLFALDSGPEFNVSARAVATATIDTLSPSRATSFNAQSVGRTVVLSWVNPTDLDFGSVSIVRNEDNVPTSVSDGELVVSSFTGTGNIDEGLSDGTYYYALFAFDQTLNSSLAVTASALVDANPPHKPTSFTVTRSADVATLTWINPNDTDFASVVIRRATDGFVGFVEEGVLVSENRTSTAGAVVTMTQFGLTEGFTYFYSVFAKDYTGNASDPAQASVAYPAPDITAPKPPRSFRTTVSDASVRLAWTVPTENDFLSVQLCRSDFSFPSLNVDVVSTNIKGSTYLDVSLANGTYYYSLFANDTSGNYSKVATVSVTIYVQDVVPPAKPTNFSASVSGKTVYLSWINPADVDFSSVILKRNDVVVTANTKRTVFSDLTLSEGVQLYTLFAKDLVGNISASTSLSVSIDTRPPARVTAVSATAKGNVITLKWTNPSDLDFSRLDIYRSTIEYPTTIEAGDKVASLSVSATTFTQTGLTDGRYYYGIFTVDRLGNTSQPVTVNSVSDSTAPHSVSDLVIVPSSNYRALLQWTLPASDVTDVTIYRSTVEYPTSKSGVLVTQNSAISSFVDTDLFIGTYYYAVFVNDANANFSLAATQSVNIAITQQEFLQGIKVDGGSLEITSNSETVVTNPIIGLSGIASVSVNATLKTNGLVLGDRLGSTGLVVIQTPFSVIQEEGSLAIGRFGIGKVVQSNGAVYVLGSLILGVEAGSSGNYTLSGGILYADTIQIGGAGSGSITWTGGSLEAKTIVGNLQNKGGTLVVNSNSPLEITGSYTQEASAKMAITLNSVNRAILKGTDDNETSSSLITISALADISGEIAIVLDGYSPKVGDRICLIKSGTKTTRSLRLQAAELTLNLPELDDGKTWDTSLFQTYGIIQVLGSSSKLVEKQPLNYPNPFKLGTGTHIGYFLNEAADIELRVYLKTGQEAYRVEFPSGIEGGKVGQNYVPLSTSIVGQDWPSGAYFYLLFHQGKVVARGRMGVLPE